MTALCGAAAGQVVAALSVGVLFWGPLLFLSPRDSSFDDRLTLLYIVLGNQVGCLLVALVRNTGSFRGVGNINPDKPSTKGAPTKSLVLRALPTALLGTSLAVVLGIVYDMLLRVLFGNDAPTIGPGGAARSLSPLAGGFIVAAGISLGPFADECFFRAVIFRAWSGAGAPRLGALVSSVLFALSRFDMVNFPAYVGLGLLLCTVYHRTGSLLAPLTMHVLLNVAMFGLLFSGYQ
jgi:membrane protease YdiL (CAAX protease family)